VEGRYPVSEAFILLCVKQVECLTALHCFGVLELRYRRGRRPQSNFDNMILARDKAVSLRQIEQFLQNCLWHPMRPNTNSIPRPDLHATDH
jgi:hypothetical protein